MIAKDLFSLPLLALDSSSPPPLLHAPSPLFLSHILCCLVSFLPALVGWCLFVFWNLDIVLISVVPFFLMPTSRFLLCQQGPSGRVQHVTSAALSAIEKALARWVCFVFTAENMIIAS